MHKDKKVNKNKKQNKLQKKMDNNLLQADSITDNKSKSNSLKDENVTVNVNIDG